MQQYSELTVDAAAENIAVVTDFVNEQLERFGCPMKAQTQIDIAVDEIFSNIAYYAYAPGTGPATVRVEYCAAPPSVVLVFTDGGVPYDPLKKADPDVKASADERTIGGLGIYIVKKSMDDIAYSRVAGKNVLSVRKNF